MENKVIDSRLSKDGQVIRRRRECNDCGKRFTTYERIEEIMPQVVKSDSRREPFEHMRLVQSIQEACNERPVALQQIEQMVEEIEKQLQETGEKEVESSVIGEEVLIRLSEIDDIAYIRFAARHRRYRDLGQFAEELNSILAERERTHRSGGQRS
jgi:transcriptional repressor NrdR